MIGLGLPFSSLRPLLWRRDSEARKRPFVLLRRGVALIDSFFLESYPIHLHDPDFFPNIRLSLLIFTSSHPSLHHVHVFRSAFTSPRPGDSSLHLLPLTHPLASLAFIALVARFLSLSSQLNYTNLYYSLVSRHAFFPILSHPIRIVLTLPILGRIGVLTPSYLTPRLFAPCFRAYHPLHPAFVHATCYPTHRFQTQLRN